MGFKVFIRTFLNKTAPILLASIGLIATTTSVRANYAYPDVFLCEQDADGVFTTYATRGDFRVPIFRWIGGLGPSTGYSWQARCEIVSDRLQALLDDRSLHYITNSYMNEIPVVCTARYLGGSCEDLLFSLSPNQAEIVPMLRQLGDLERLASGPIRQPYTGSCIEIQSDRVSDPDLDDVYSARAAGCVTEENGTVYVDLLGVIGHATN